MTALGIAAIALSSLVALALGFILWGLLWGHPS